MTFYPLCKEEDERPHTPVLVKEVIEIFNPMDGQIYVDMTFGAGGHSEAILKSAKNVRIFALDRDPLAYEYAKRMSHQFGGRVVPMLGKFSEVRELLQANGVVLGTVDGILFDVGMSSMQLSDSSRGFALSTDGPLDMRMDGDRNLDQPTARDVINTLDEASLTRIFKVYGEEKLAPVVAQTIVEARYMMKRIDTTSHLAALVQNATDRDYKRVDKLGRTAHIATKVFQALRIFVNNELNELNRGLELAYDILRPDGNLVAITFHSLEDRIVKRHLQGVDMNDQINVYMGQKFKAFGKWHSIEDVKSVYSNRWTIRTKKAVVPSAKEIDSNPRSRSAKLRAACKNVV